MHGARDREHATLISDENADDRLLTNMILAILSLCRLIYAYLHIYFIIYVYDNGLTLRIDSIDHFGILIFVKSKFIVKLRNIIIIIIQCPILLRPITWIYNT